MDGWMDGEKRNWRGRTFFPPFNGRNCVQLFPCLVAGTVSSIVRPTLDSWNSFPFIEIYRVYNSPLLLISFFPGIEPRFSRIFLSSLLHWKSTNFADEISFGFAIWDNVRRSVSRRITHIYILARLFIFLSQRFEVILHFTSSWIRGIGWYFFLTPRCLAEEGNNTRMNNE